MLLLTETYFRALTPTMQSDMTQKKFKMPKNHQFHSKTALNEVWSEAIQSYERKHQTDKTIKAQVQATMLSAGTTVQPTASVYHIAASGQDHFQHDPFPRALTEDEVNALEYNGSNNLGAKNTVHQTYLIINCRQNRHSRITVNMGKVAHKVIQGYHQDSNSSLKRKMVKNILNI